MKIKVFFLIFLAFPLFAPRMGSPFDLQSKVSPFRLSNGMRWLYVYRPQMPVFSGMVLVKAGGADESLGKTGLAHMFEHMAFKGSKDVGTKNYAKELLILKKIGRLGKEMAFESQKENPNADKILQLKDKIQELTKEEYRYMVPNEIWETLSRKGGADLNAFTTKDATGYHASMPATQFPLWAYLTSEMTLFPVMREFYQERDVVLEERRLRYENSPQGFLLENFIETAFPEGPYHWSPIGFEKDLHGLTMEDAIQFHQNHYLPQNMVGVLVGAIPKQRAKAVLERFFGRKGRRGGNHKELKQRSFAFQGRREKTISFPAEPSLVVAFYKPRAPARDDYVFDILNELLCEGRTGRLYQELVKEKKLALSISCSASFPGSRQDNLFSIFANPNKGISLKKLEDAIFMELRKIAEDVRPEELEKVRHSVLYNFFWGLENNMGLAEQLAVSEAILGDWHYITTYTRRIQGIQKEETQKIADKYFRSENQVVVYRKKGEKENR